MARRRALKVKEYVLRIRKPTLPNRLGEQFAKGYEEGRKAAR
jgi:hypothetical protein